MKKAAKGVMGAFDDISSSSVRNLNGVGANITRANDIVDGINAGLPIGGRAAPYATAGASLRGGRGGLVETPRVIEMGGPTATAMPAAGLVGSPARDTAGRIADAADTYLGGVRDVGSDIKRGAKNLWVKTKEYLTGADIEGATDFKRQMGGRYAITGGAVAGSLAAIGMMNSSEDRRMQRNVQRATGGYGY